ncbi:hypothetical protein B0J11DRAFT_512101 [Dendryphion nanum]|uniref:Uncharacterized protein n=1 Tax=Dendryphion nanum TaxID=256645 RepID=A0A9P9D3C6_9PLEO|nr:hypothetical protein B0J11DRAFT_512101 [Dendryphion nanum]
MCIVIAWPSESARLGKNAAPALPSNPIPLDDLDGFGPPPDYQLSIQRRVDVTMVILHHSKLISFVPSYYCTLMLRNETLLRFAEFVGSTKVTMRPPPRILSPQDTELRFGGNTVSLTFGSSEDFAGTSKPVAKWH